MTETNDGKTIGFNIAKTKVATPIDFTTFLKLMLQTPLVSATSFYFVLNINSNIFQHFGWKSYTAIGFSNIVFGTCCNTSVLGHVTIEVVVKPMCLATFVSEVL